MRILIRDSTCRVSLDCNVSRLQSDMRIAAMVLSLDATMVRGIGRILGWCRGCRSWIGRCDFGKAIELFVRILYTGGELK
jgi:hypothetical protein